MPRGQHEARMPERVRATPLVGTPLDNDHRLRSVSLQTSLPLSVPNDALTMTWPMPAAEPPHTRLSPVP